MNAFIKQLGHWAMDVFALSVLLWWLIAIVGIIVAAIYHLPFWWSFAVAVAVSIGVVSPSYIAPLFARRPGEHADRKGD